MLKKTGLIPLLLSPILFILLVPVIILAIIINEIGRFVVSKLLYKKYKNKIKLIPNGSDSAFAFKKEGSTRNVIVYIVTKAGTLDPERIAGFYSSKMQSLVDPLSGIRPYAKLEKILTQKFGYFCWKDTSDTFDVRNHIRVMDKEKLYTQTDIYELASEFIKDMDESKPQWEFIILPRFEDGTGNERSILMVRFQHTFMDGLSFVMLFKEHFSIDSNYSINPLTFRIPLWKKVLYYTSGIIYGPYALVVTLYQSFYFTPWITKNSKLSGQKYYTSTKPISSETVRQIRINTDNATLTNIISTAFAKSVAKVIPKDRRVSEVLISDVLAILPYPNFHPQNRVTCFTYGIPINEVEDDDDHLDRIIKCKKDSLDSLLGPETLLVFYSMKTWGRFPSKFHNFFLTGAPGSIFLSNVPFSKTKCSLKDGTEILKVGAWSPHFNDTGFSVTIIGYGDEIKICGCADSSWLCREELCQIIDGIPKEIEIMAKLCNALAIKKID